MIEKWIVYLDFVLCEHTRRNLSDIWRLFTEGQNPLETLAVAKFISLGILFRASGTDEKWSFLVVQQIHMSSSPPYPPLLLLCYVFCAKDLANNPDRDHISAFKKSQHKMAFLTLCTCSSSFDKNEISPEVKSSRPYCTSVWENCIKLNLLGALWNAKLCCHTIYRASTTCKYAQGLLYANDRSLRMA